MHSYTLPTAARKYQRSDLAVAHPYLSAMRPAMRLTVTSNTSENLSDHLLG